MKRAHHVLMAIATALSLSVAGAAAQQPAEASRLGVLVGEWTYDLMDGGAKCAWLGELIIHCTSDWTAEDGSKQGLVMLTRWDPAKSVYTAYRFYKTGYADAGFGWLAGDTWTLVYDGELGTRLKFVGRIDANTWRYTWYRSRSGGDWEKTSEGSMTRVARTPR